MKDFLALMNPTRWAILAGVAAVLLALAGGMAVKIHKSGVGAGRTEVRADWLAADNAALRESQREVSRLVTVNQEVQHAYNKILGQLADADAARADAAGLRNEERAAIVAEAGRAAAGTCARYAAISEQHIEGIERDAEQMGRLAVRATANAEALQRTLRERRGALDAKREALNRPTTKEKP